MDKESRFPITNLFPEREIVLIPEFSKFSQFFPIATIDLSSIGVKRPIPITYVFFDHQEVGFKKGDDIDHFSFYINEDGKARPSFTQKALELSPSYEKRLEESIQKFETYKVEKDLFLFDDYPEPEWLQQNETPKTLFFKTMTYIGQLDTDKFSIDSCRMFLFYKKKENLLRIIYQRT